MTVSVLIAGSDTRIVELRVAGARATSAESVVDAVAAVDVAGDDAGRFVRPADRLRRPAPGPVLTASGRSLPRTVEGFLWGGAAGRTASRCCWALLLPFALTNTALRMLPPLPADRGLGSLLRALVRAVALALTCLLVAEITHISALWFAWTDPLAPAAVGWVVPALLAVAVAVALVPAARLAGPAWAGLPRSVRPWAGGWAAAPVLALAVLLGAGASAALTTVTLWATGTPSAARYSVWTEAPLVAWGAVGTLALSAVPVTTMWWVVRGRSGVAVELPSPGHGGRAAAAWWRAGLVRDHAHQLAAGAVAALVACTAAAPWLPRPVWAQAAGVAVLASVAVVVLRVGVGRRDPDGAGGSGVADVLWQLVACWPREAHPVAPPSHLPTAVPLLVRRAREHLEDPNVRLVLCGHGHGALLATLTAARLLDGLPAADRERVGLVTAGAPLLWACARAFPSVVPHSFLVELAGRLDGRWRALCRGTDPVGGGVTTWRRQVVAGTLLGMGMRTEDGTPTVGPLTATRGPGGVLVLGCDHWLPDPAQGPCPGRRWRGGVLGHRDYLADPEWDRAVALAAGLAPATAPGPRPAFSRGRA